MSIESLSQSTISSVVSSIKSSVSSQSSKTSSDDSSKATTAKDGYVSSQTAASGTSSTYSAKLSANQVTALRLSQFSKLESLISQTFSDQSSNISESILNISGNSSITKSIYETISEAQSTASEESTESSSVDDYWGVDAVATRIMDMVQTVSGGDNSMLSSLKDAVEEGFNQAGISWGSDLPQICNDTYDEIMNRFDFWETNGTLDGYGLAEESETETAAESV